MIVEAAGDSTSEAAGRSQTDVVIQGIKDMITGGELVAGSRLPIEKDLSARFSVSRGSLREGVRALATLGVLETRQGDGTYVTSLDPALLLSPIGFLAELQTPADSAHLLAVRRILESESAARAALLLTDQQLEELSVILDRVDDILRSDDSELDLEGYIDADTEFHRTIARASGNPALAGLIESLVGRTFRARLWRAITERKAVRDTQAEHRAILAELVSRDPDRARIRMSVHVLGVEEFASDHQAEVDPARAEAGGSRTKPSAESSSQSASGISAS